jgi:hypothetical protein
MHVPQLPLKSEEAQRSLLIWTCKLKRFGSQVIYYRAVAFDEWFYFALTEMPRILRSLFEYFPPLKCACHDTLLTYTLVPSTTTQCRLCFASFVMILEWD